MLTDNRSLQAPEQADPLRTCIRFLQQIGIPVAEGPLAEPGFLPGLSIERGTIRLDRQALLFPGDLLHEAGHIAVVPAAERASLSGESIAGRQDRAAEEMMAIAWSYAACVHLGLDADFVFHEGGYQGGGGHIAAAFRGGGGFGLPMLRWVGMTADEKQAPALGVPPYPHMLRWLRN